MHRFLIRSILPSAGLRAVLLAVPLVLSLTGGGCKDDKRITPPPPYVSPYQAQNSIANVLANFKTAYEARNFDEYRKLFAEDYRFYFNPADVHSGDNPTPESWGYADEMAATENMFHDDLVDQIQVDYTIGTPERADSVLYGAHAWKVRLTEANLRVVTRNEGGEPLTYLVPGTTELFYLRQSATETVDGQPKWHIFRWDDQPIAKTETKSWGQVKHAYR
jgi:hypothetical protein